MGAPLNPVPGVLRVFLEGVIDNENVEKWGNVLHYQYTGTPPTDAICAAFASAIASTWATNMAPACPSPTQLTQVQVTDLTSPSSGEGTWVGNHPGTRGDDSIPANAALLISYVIQNRYKGGHPRTYLYVLGNADLQGASEWSTAATAEVQADWRSFQNTVGTLSDAGTVFNGFCAVRYRGKFLPNSGPPHFYLDTPIVMPIAVTGMDAVQQIASQRRRVGRRKA